jgi:hypothetical protein
MLFESNVAKLMLYEIIVFGNLKLINSSKHSEMVVRSMYNGCHGDLHVSGHGGIVIWLATGTHYSHLIVGSVVGLENFKTSCMLRGIPHG